MSNEDFSKFIDEPQTDQLDHVWLVSFTAKLPIDAILPEELECSDCGEEHDIDDLRTVSDDLSVLAGIDGQVAIDKARTKVLSAEYTPQLTDFVLTGLHLQAVIEVS